MKFNRGRAPRQGVTVTVTVPDWKQHEAHRGPAGPGGRLGSCGCRWPAGLQVVGVVCQCESGLVLMLADSEATGNGECVGRAYSCR
jgi:hypothetical protein